MIRKIGKSLIISYIVSFILLLIFAMIMYYGNVSDGVVGFFVISTYFISTIVGGLSIGKGADNRKFIWGMGLGALYFCIILIISLIGKDNQQNIDFSKFIGLITSCIGGMIGGMIS